MESSDDKNWATKYLLDPLNAPEPSQETGLGTHHNATMPVSSRFSDSISTSTSHNSKKEPSATARSINGLPNVKTGSSVGTSSVRSSNNPYRSRDSNSNGNGYPTPPESTSPHTSHFPDFDASLGHQTPHTTGASTQIPTSTGGRNSSINGSEPVPNGESHHHRRTSSLSQRHPGDQTHHPLEMLKRNSMRANRAPHLRKKHHIGADSIDTLDGTSGTSAWHHEGPYDATLLARNTDPRRAPVMAVRGGNREALRATPREMVEDSVKRHRPLDGVAVVPPGMVGPAGRVMRYKEGSDMMIDGDPEGGAYKRWPGIKYLPEDLKGKGEPSFSIERALKADQNQLNSQPHRRNVSESQAQPKGMDNTGGIEMNPLISSPRRSMSVGGGSTSGFNGANQPRYSEWENGNVARSQSGTGAKLRKRLGSLGLKGRET